MKRPDAMPPEELGAVPASSLARAEAEEAAKRMSNGGGNLPRHVAHQAPEDLKSLRADREALIAKLLDVNHRIALTETLAAISPKDDA